MKFSMLWFGLQTEFYSTQDITLRTPTKKTPFLVAFSFIVIFTVM